MLRSIAALAILGVLAGCSSRLLSIYKEANPGRVCPEGSVPRFEVVLQHEGARAIEIKDLAAQTTRKWLVSPPPSRDFINLNAKHLFVYPRLARFTDDCSKLIAVGSWATGKRRRNLWSYNLNTSSESGYQEIEEADWGAVLADYPGLNRDDYY